MKCLLTVVLVLSSITYAQEPAHYWTTRRTVETIGVTALHMVDAGQTCYHMQQQYNIEVGIGTPHTCAGASIYLVLTT